MKVSLVRIGSNAIVSLDKKSVTLPISSELFYKVLEDKVREYQRDLDKILNVGSISRFLDKVFPDRVSERVAKASSLMVNYLVEPDVILKAANAQILKNYSSDFIVDSSDNVYYKNLQEPFPKILVDTLVGVASGDDTAYTIESLVMFWQVLSLNPDKHIRNGLFTWLLDNGFSITHEGNIISYRDVDEKSADENPLHQFLFEYFLNAKRWKKNPKKCLIYKKPDESYYFRDISKPSNRYKSFELLGTLEELYEKAIKESKTIYTDQRTGSMDILIGSPVKMKRSNCDNNQDNSCSAGLHQKSHKYTYSFGEITLTCLVSPFHVVAIPIGEPQKFRCCQYLPVGLTKKINGSVVPFKSGTFEISYNGIEDIQEELEHAKALGVISEEHTKESAISVLNQYREYIKRSSIEVQ